MHGKREASASPLESNGFAPHIPSNQTLEFSPNPLRSVEPPQDLVNLKLSGTLVKGLCNLGNTCFMNSALQCLSHTMPLTIYFLKCKWKNDLNYDNPLGSGDAQLAKAYCALIERLWDNDSNSSVSPRDFKLKIGEFNSLFKGYSQQDSQELLQSLLDGLHEDLNRILKKPFIEIPEMDHLSLQEMASKSWELYCKRNDSVIVDLFQGQYKSRVECLKCGKSSLKFDPYMFISCPIPGASKTLISVTVLPMGQSMMNLEACKFSLIKLQGLESSQKVSLVLNKDGSVESLIHGLAEKLNWDLKLPCLPKVFEVFDSKIYKIFQESDPISLFSKGDMICVFAPDYGDPALKVLDWQSNNSLDLLFSNFTSDLNLAFSPYEESVRIPVYFSSSENDFTHTFGSLFGLPSSLCLPKTLTIRIPEMFAKACNDDQLSLECLRILGLYVYRHLLLNMIKYFKPLFPTKEQPSALDFIDFLKENDVPWSTFKDVLKITLIEGSDRSGDSDSFYSREFLSPYNGTQKSIYPIEAVHITADEDSKNTEKVSSLTTLGSATLIDDSPVEFRYFKFNATGLKLFMVQWKAEEAQNFFGKDSLSKSVSYEFQKSVFAPSQNHSNTSLAAQFEAEKRGNKKITLEDCIKEYSREETLGEQDTWYCPTCKDHQRIKKKIDIWSVPNILVFHLKRFSNTGRFSLMGDKIDVFVNAPLEGLDLSGMVQGPIQSKDDLIYDLYAISNHFGGVGGGHYTAYAKNPIDKEWYNLDDSYASKTTEASIMTNAAYLLFYERRKTKIDDSEIKSVIASFEPSFSADAVNPLASGNTPNLSNLDVSYSSSSSADSARTVPIPIGARLDNNAPPPPPYPGTLLDSYSLKAESISPARLHRNSSSLLENFSGDQEQEISNDNDTNNEPLWIHGNIDP